MQSIVLLIVNILQSYVLEYDNQNKKTNDNISDYVLIKIIGKEVCYLKIICIFAPSKSPNGGIGRRTGFKIQRSNIRAGSIPALGT